MLHCVAIIKFCLSILHLINNLGCFSHLTIINNASVNILVQFFCFTFYCMGCMFWISWRIPRSGIAGSYDNFMLKFFKNFHTFFPNVAAPFYILISYVWWLRWYFTHFVYMVQFMHSTVDGHLCCFQFFAVIHKDLVNTLPRVIWRTCAKSFFRVYNQKWNRWIIG